MTTVDAARAALLELAFTMPGDHIEYMEASLVQAKLDALIAAVRAEYTGWYTPTEKRLRRERDAAEAKLAALREDLVSLPCFEYDSCSHEDGSPHTKAVSRRRMLAALEATDADR